MFTTGFIEERNTASLFPLQNQDCKTIAAANKIRSLLKEKNSLPCMGVTGRTWVTPINTFFMSLCCSPLSWQPMPGLGYISPAWRGVWMSDAGRWSKLGQPAISVKQWLFAPGHEVPLLVWPLEYKAFVRNPEKSEPNQFRVALPVFTEKLMYSSRTHLPPDLTQALQAGVWWNWGPYVPSC